MLWDDIANVQPLKTKIPTGQTHTHDTAMSTKLGQRRWRSRCTCGAQGSGRTKTDALYSLSLHPCTVLEAAHG